MYHYRFYTRTKPNGDVYVGRSRKQKVEYRWCAGYSFDTTDTIDEVIFECDCSEHDANIIETYFIMKYNAMRKGLNKNYGHAMEYWYILPCYYNNWREYIEDNYQKVFDRLEYWVKNFLGKT